MDVVLAKAAVREARRVHVDRGSPVQCGGVGGLTCPKSQACIDDPSDACDPDAGDIDCAGTCQDRSAT